MAKVFATLIDEVQQELQDTAGATYGDTEVAVQLEDAIREVSEYEPRVVQYTYELESRTGTATSTLSTWIVDSSAQFIAATDVGKVIYNTTDRTWAKVISNGSNSTTQLNLNKDIMASGEDYAIFNEECWNNRQIYIGDITDYIGGNHGVIAVEYETLNSPRKYRNFKVEGDVLTIDIDFEPPDSSSSTADIEVFVWIQRRHQATQQTVTTLYVDYASGYSAGDTAILVDYDGGAVTGTIKEGTNFTIAETRGDYMVTADATFSGNEVTLQIFPALENDIANDKTIWLMKSSLDNRLERLVVELTAAKCLISKSLYYISTVNVGGADVAKQFTATGHDKLAVVRSELARLVKPKTKRVWPKE